MYDFGIIGGDIRQMYIAEYLADAGYSVFCYGVENMDKNNAKNMEEVFENREQIEISKYYERQPKPDLVAIYEFEHNEISYRMAKHDEE